MAVDTRFALGLAAWVAASSLLVCAAGCSSDGEATGGGGTAGSAGSGASGGSGASAGAGGGAGSSAAGGSGGSGASAGSSGAGGGGGNGGAAGSGVQCGDGDCSAGESCGLCPGDCGPCPTRPGIYISQAEIDQLPIAGDSACDAACEAAWNDLVSLANSTPASPNISDQDEQVGQIAMAKALYYARVGDSAKRQEVFALLQAVVGTEAGARALAVGRELASYVFAADIVDLNGLDSGFDANTFRPWLSDLVDTTDLAGRTLEGCHEDRPNNWGAHCGASRAAAAAYLALYGDAAEQTKGNTQLDGTDLVFQGFAGDRTAYAGFSYGDLGWQCDPSQPVGINPTGCVVDGHNYDGIIPDDQRRTTTFTWPPDYTHYAYGNLEGTTVMAEVLQRRGYAPWSYSNQAVLRAVQWLWYDGDGKTRWDTCNSEQNKQMVLDLIDRAYDTDFIQRMSCYDPADPSPVGRNVAATRWTHQPARGTTTR